jgi:excinuclease ABC subunit A
MGPGAGEHGGEIVAHGTPEAVASAESSTTGAFLSGRRAIPVPAQRTPVDPERVLRILGARGNNLQNVTLELPVGLMTCVTGVSGSGKSTLINDTLYAIASRDIHRSSMEPAAYDEIEGLDQFDKVISVDQAPIGRTPRSNPATYTGLLTPIRELFAGVPESRARGYGPGRFSFNVKGGRCEARATACCASRCTFCPTCTCPATSATASATTAKPSKSATRASPSPMCWR